MDKPVKNDGKYDKRSKEHNRSTGGTDAPKTNEKKFKGKLKTKNKPGKKV